MDGRMDKTLTVVWLLADGILGSSPQPPVESVRLRGHFAVFDHQGHVIDGVNGSIQATPPQQDTRATVHQGQCLGAVIQRQARGCGHVEETVT